MSQKFVVIQNQCDVTYSIAMHTGASLQLTPKGTKDSAIKITMTEKEDWKKFVNFYNSLKSKHLIVSYSENTDSILYTPAFTKIDPRGIKNLNASEAKVKQLREKNNLKRKLAINIRTAEIRKLIAAKKGEEVAPDTKINMTNRTIKAVITPVKAASGVIKNKIDMIKKKIMVSKEDKFDNVNSVADLVAISAGKNFDIVENNNNDISIKVTSVDSEMNEVPPLVIELPAEEDIVEDNSWQKELTANNVVAEAPVAQVNLDEMSKSQLIEFANAKGIDVSEIRNTKKIREALREKLNTI